MCRRRGLQRWGPFYFWRQYKKYLLLSQHLLFLRQIDEMDDKTNSKWCTCPTCGGSGSVELVLSTAETNRPLAIKLRQKGYTIRQIAKMLGYKNPGSISNLLK